MKKTNLIIYLTIILGLSSCYDLNKEPEGVLSTTNPFTSTGEMMSYLDQFYQNAVRVQDFGVGGGGGIAGGDVHSDNMSSNSVSTRLAGENSLSNAASLSNYNQIRNVNFFLNNLDSENPEKGSPLYNQYVGEGYYFRAWYYYQMFVSYGQLTWVNRPLEPNMEIMQLERDSRTVIADSILADLDKAIQLLSEQSNKIGRAHV